MLLLVSLVPAVRAMAAEARVQIEIVSSEQSGLKLQSGLAPSFPVDVDFEVEPLYPKRNNQSRAKIEILYSCVDADSGGLIVPCYITLDPPVARENSGGHFAGHTEPRPVGRNVPSEGWVSDADGRLHATYYASEVGGIVDVAIHCTTAFIPCRDGSASFGVGFQGLEDLGPGTGYVLVGAKSPHPSNHWGVPAFFAAARLIASRFADDYPNDPLQFNDASLQYGGVFDVVAKGATGYDWTPPHSTHRLGTNMDIGIPRGSAAKSLFLRLCQLNGVRVLQEDAYHWHLMY
jgi:hypothetical protein